MWRVVRVVVAMALAATAGNSAFAAKRPNILLIVADDLGYADLGVHGCKDIATPAIDRLAKSGVRLTNGYVSGPYCSPTRAGLLTGRYQQRFGHEFNPGPPRVEATKVGLPLTETTLAQRLRTAGYRTGMVGKWHLGHGDGFHPLDRGFEEYFGFLGGAHGYSSARAADSGPNAVQRGRKPVDEPEYLTDAFAREAVAYVERHKDEPFFLYLAFNAVHTPLEAPAKYTDRFPDIENPKRRTYAAMLAAMDDAIGQVVAKLKETGLEENTLVFFISDNGGPAVNASDNGALRGHKAQTWEGGIRVPFFVSWPRRLPAGQKYDHPAIQLDILPTALAAAGAPLAAGEKLDGVDLLPHLQGDNKAAPHDQLYWRFGPQSAIRAGDWKLVKAVGASEGMLINLVDDPGEKMDLSIANPEKRKALELAWQAWSDQLEEPRWKVNRAAGAGKKKKRQMRD